MIYKPNHEKKDVDVMVRSKDAAKLAVLMIIASLATFSLYDWAGRQQAVQPSLSASPDMSGLRPALEHEIEAALKYSEVALSPLRERIWVALRSLREVPREPGVVILPHGLRWEGETLGYTALLLKNVSSDPYGAFTNARFLFDWLCYGELIDVVAKGSCKDPAARKSGSTAQMQANASWMRHEDFARFGIPNDFPFTTFPGNLTVAPAGDDWRYIMLEPGAKVVGGQLGLHKITTPERYRQPELSWTMLYDPFCELVARETSGLRRELMRPLREYIADETLERYAACAGPPLKDRKAQQPEPARPSLAATRP